MGPYNQWRPIITIQTKKEDKDNAVTMKIIKQKAFTSKSYSLPFFLLKIFKPQ